eukprot:504380-Amphidinium_carterae.1
MSHMKGSEGHCLWIGASSEIHARRFDIFGTQKKLVGPAFSLLSIVPCMNSVFLLSQCRKPIGARVWSLLGQHVGATFTSWGRVSIRPQVHVGEQFILMRQLVLLEEQHDYLAVSCCRCISVPLNYWCKRGLTVHTAHFNRCCPYEECFDCFKGSELHPNFIKTTAEGEDTVGASVLLA